MWQANILESPYRVFDLPGDLALEDASSYQLTLMFHREGWAWMEWQPPSKRKKKDQPLPIGYTQGGPQIYYTTQSEFHRSYLLALCMSDDLFEHGLVIVPHRSTESEYAKICRGIFPSVAAAIEDAILEPDVDAEPLAIEDGQPLGIEPHALDELAPLVQVNLKMRSPKPSRRHRCQKIKVGLPVNQNLRKILHHRRQAKQLMKRWRRYETVLREARGVLLR